MPDGRAPEADGRAEAGRVIERAATPHGELVLRQAGTEFEIISDGVFLMDTRDGRSERLLVTEALARCASPAPRVLIGGLGVGFSLAAAAAADHARAIDVVEISPDVIRWHGRYLSHISGAARADPRVRVIEADFAGWLARQDGRYDAICLDVDNGPDWTVRRPNEVLYQDAGLARLRAALNPGGALSVWSAAAVPWFAERLRHHFRAVHTFPVPVPRGEPDVVYVATREAHAGRSGG